MGITFACGQCKKRYELDSSLAGRRVKCKACGTAMTVPAATPTPTAPRQAPAPGRRPAPVVDDVDDRFGLDDVEPARGQGPAEAVLPRAGRRPGGSSASTGVPPWVWIAGGVAGMVLVVLMGAMVFSGLSRPRAVVQNPAGEPAPEGAPVDPSPAGEPAPGFIRDEASAAAPKSVWRVKVDPAPEKVEFPVIAKMAIPVPDAYGGDKVLYPTTPSAFVVMGGNDSDDHFREVYDLRTATRAGRLKGRIESARPMALSPDGVYLAVHTNPVPRTTDIWRVSDAKRIGRIQDDDRLPDYIDFAGPGEGRVVIGASLSHDFHVWDVLAGKPVVKFKTPERADRDSIALSPGRRYLATTLYQKSRLLVYDLTTGGLAGDYEMSKDDNDNLDCEAMAFSPDGTALVGLFNTLRNTHLMVWDVATGKLVSDFRTEARDPYGKNHSNNGQIVQWLPDQSGWLIHDQTVVERQSGAPVWNLPFDKKRSDEEGPRKILDADRMISMAKVNNREMIRLVALPKDKIQTAMTLARGGGNAADATLPPTTAADVVGAKAVSTIPGPVAWTAPAAKDKPKTPAPATASGKSIPLKVTGLDVMGLLVSGPEAPTALVFSSPGARLDSNKGKPSQLTRQVDRYDLATGRPVARFEMPWLALPLAFAPGSARFLVTHDKGADRLDLYATDGKHLAGWRPYEAESGDDRNVVWADFLDAGRVLTVNPSGTLVLWSVPDCKAVYVAGQAMQGWPVLSPDRKSLAVFRGGRLRLIDPETGAAVGDSVTSGHEAPLGFKAAAIDPEGKELAAILDGTLVSWDLKTGQVVGEMPSPVPKADLLQFGAARHVLLDNKVLVDLERRRTVWHYEGGVHERGGSGGLHRYASGPIGRPAVLATLQVPDPKIVRAEAAAADPKVKAMLREGSTVSVQIVGDPPREPETFRRGLIDGLTARLQAVGVKVADNQPVRVVVSFKERDLGRSVELRMRQEKRMIQDRELEWELAAVDAQGPPVVIARDTVRLLSTSFIDRLPAGENDWEGYFRTRQWYNAAAKSVAHDAPSFVARRPDGPVILPGWTHLGEPTI